MKGKPSLPSKRALALPDFFSYKIRVPRERERKREREGGKKTKQKKTRTITESQKNTLFFKSKRKDENVFQATV